MDQPENGPSQSISQPPASGERDANAGSSISGKKPTSSPGAGASTSRAATEVDSAEPSQQELERQRRRDFIRRHTRRWQNNIARWLGVSRTDRDRVVASMLKTPKSDRVTYWFQLILSLGIATIGLVLNSTGVVIGAMLISPLMGPIVGLGMGLAIGSPFLTLRSATRVASSILGVLLLAAVLTMLLPFTQVTPEISARTSPTALDLMVACFCALAAGFTTIRTSSDTVSAAAGTAIGISLVPPLCVSGFGLGTADFSIFRNALLLFTANFCAILLFTVLLFLLTGFNHINVDRHEAQDIQAEGFIARFAARLRSLFGSNLGPVFRFLMPVLFVTAVYVPLRHALKSVAWQVEARSQIEAIVAEYTPGDLSVTTNLTVEPGRIVLRLVLMASPEEARRIEHELETRVAAAANVVPHVEVLPVPDFQSLQKIASASKSTIAAPDAAIPIKKPPDLDDVNARVEACLLTSWPEAAGEFLSWDMSFDDVGAPVIELVHTGPPIGKVAEPLLGRALSNALESEVIVRDHAIDVTRRSATKGFLSAWIPTLARALADIQRAPELRACVTRGHEVIVVNPAPAPALPEPADSKAGKRRRDEEEPAPP
ncbi:MAG: DUF389 domain-containing protein, partial [Myxococcales bacterium]|nr:DUF389 domain-containing protein [Myxococcales bacterium]